MSSDNDSSWVKIVLYGACISGVALLLSPVVRNNAPAQNTIGNEISEVKALREQNLALQRVKKQDDAKINALKEQLKSRIAELLETERKWKLSQSDS